MNLRKDHYRGRGRASGRAVARARAGAQPSLPFPEPAPRGARLLSPGRNGERKKKHRKSLRAPAGEREGRRGRGAQLRGGRRVWGARSGASLPPRRRSAVGPHAAGPVRPVASPARARARASRGPRPGRRAPERPAAESRSDRGVGVGRWRRCGGWKDGSPLRRSAGNSPPAPAAVDAGTPSPLGGKPRGRPRAGEAAGGGSERGAREVGRFPRPHPPPPSPGPSRGRGRVAGGCGAGRLRASAGGTRAPRTRGRREVPRAASVPRGRSEPRGSSRVQLPPGAGLPRETPGPGRNARWWRRTSGAPPRADAPPRGAGAGWRVPGLPSAPRPAPPSGAGGGGTPAGPSGRFPHPRARYLASAPPRVRGAGRKERGAGPERAASPTPPSSPRAAEPGGGLKTRAARGARREVGGRGRSSARRRDAGMEERSPGGARRRAPPALSLPSPPAASAVAAPSVLRGAGPGRRGGHPVPPLRGLGLGRRARRARGRALAPAGLARVRSGPRRGSRPGARRSPRRCVPRPPRRARPAGRRAGRPARASRGAGGSAPPVRPACVRTPGLLPSLGASPPFPPSVASRVLSFVPAAVASHRAFALGLAGRAGRASGRSGVGRPAAGLRAEARGAGAAPESVPVPPAAVRASAAGAPPGRARGGGVGGRGAGEEGERRRGRFGARVSRTARKGPRSARAPSGGPARARAGGAAGAGGGLVCSRPRRSRRRRRRRSVAAAGLRPGRRAPSRGRPRLLRPGRAEPGAWSVPEARQGRFPRSGARAPRPSRSGRASLPAGRPSPAFFFPPASDIRVLVRSAEATLVRPAVAPASGLAAGAGRAPSGKARENESGPPARAGRCRKSDNS